MRLLERLDHVRETGLAQTRAATIPAAAFRRIADEAVRITLQHLAERPADAAMPFWLQLRCDVAKA